MNNSLADLMSELDECNQQSAWESSLKFFEKYGFHIVNYGIVDKMNGELLGFHSNMSENWMSHYMDNEYSHDDPWAHHVICDDKPISYNREGPSELAIAEGSIGEQMVNEAADFGLNSSFCVPIHNKFGHLITGFNLCSSMDHAEFKSILDERMEDILLGVALINNKLVDTPDLENKTSSWYANPVYKQLLSERELEVLKWLSEGNRNDRIAEKMNIASVTVNFHLKEIKRKLGARTREQSVALAYKKGLLR